MDKGLLLAAGLAVTFALVRFLKSDTVNEVLASKGIPPIPKHVLPWLSGFFGLAYAILVELQTRGFAAWKEALVIGLLEGLGLGGAASYIHDLGKGVPGVKKVLGVALVFFVFSQTTACSLLTPKTLRTILDITQTTCIIAHQELPESEVAKVCGVVDDLIPPMRQVLAESRKASAKAGAQKCGEQ